MGASVLIAPNENFEKHVQLNADDLGGADVLPADFSPGADLGFVELLGEVGEAITQMLNA